MKHPDLIKKLGKLKSRHSLGLFQCPFCPETFIARIDQVVNEHSTSCGCRKKKNFVAALERRVRAKVTSQALARLWGERCYGANKAYLSKKYGIRASEYPTALRLAQEAYLTPPQRTGVDSSIPVVVEKPAQQVSQRMVAPRAAVPRLVEPSPHEIVNSMNQLSQLLNAEIKSRLRRNVFEMNGEMYIHFGKMPMGTDTPALARELRDAGLLGEKLRLIGDWKDALN